MQNQPPAPDPFIVRVDTYENHLGQRVFDRVVVSGAPPAGFHRFVGVGQINVQNSPVGPINQPFNFTIDADTVDRAFAMFEPSAQVEGRRVLQTIMAEIRRQQTAIHPASPADLSLLDASGNPVRKART